MTKAQKIADLNKFKQNLPDLIKAASDVRDMDLLMINLFSPKSFDERRVLKEECEAKFHETVAKYNQTIYDLEQQINKFN